MNMRRRIEALEGVQAQTTGGDFFIWSIAHREANGTLQAVPYLGVFCGEAAGLAGETLDCFRERCAGHLAAHAHSSEPAKAVRADWTHHHVDEDAR
jgi:hypothetical protein